jgi:hypothetical protein
MENKILFRCSSLGKIMTNPRSKSETLSETCKTYLIDVFIKEKYGREKVLDNKYINKGLQAEEDAITLFSRAKKSFFKKNDTRLTNEFLSGEPDLFVGETVTSATEIIDIKTSWDIFTFWKSKLDDLNKDYFYQLQGYMCLTGAKSSTLAYCLIDTPQILVDDEKKKLFYKMGLIDENKDFIEACAKIDTNMVYSDIPIAERIHTIEIQRDEEVIEQMKSRIVECRKYLNETFGI